MNIAVIQPQGHKSGTTTVSALLALELAGRHSNVCLTCISPQSETIYPYFGIHTELDKQNVSLEMINLIKFGGMKKEKAGNYCRSVSDYLDIFVAGQPYKEGVLTQEDLTGALTFMGTTSPYDYVIYDFDDSDLSGQVAKEVISICDMCFIVVTQNAQELGRLKKDMTELLKPVRKLPMAVIVNKYMPLLGNLKATAASVGVKNIKNWSTIHFNPYIQYCANRGKFAMLYDEISKNSAEVVELNSDIWHMAKKVMEIKKITRDIRVEAKKKKG